MEFPNLVYRKGAGPYPMEVPGIGVVACLGVNDAGEYAAALADGWVGCVPDLMADDAAHDGAPTRDEMMVQAAKLGIEVDKRWGDKRLMAAIEAAL